MLYDESVANSERYLANQDKVHVDYLKVRAWLRKEHTDFKAVVAKADLPVGYASVLVYLRNGSIPRKYLEAIDNVFEGPFYAYVTEQDQPVETTEPEAPKTAAELEEENAAQESASATEENAVRAAILDIEDETFFNAIVEEWHLLHDKIVVEVNGSSFKIEKRKLEAFLRKEGEAV